MPRKRQCLGLFAFKTEQMRRAPQGAFRLTATRGDLMSTEFNGINYFQFLNLLSKNLQPKTYFEIGTQNGYSLSQIDCDAVCVDPQFQISSNVWNSRKQTHLFQMTSDEFFRNTNFISTLWPQGIDLAFLDGLHRFEALLKDFFNTEKLCHSQSVILLHDCLPTSTAQLPRWSDTGINWTGDVWKLLPILKKYRPDLRVHLLDCPPTGLVSITNLNPKSTVLQDNYYKIVDEFAQLDLDDQGIVSLRNVYPMIHSEEFVNIRSDWNLLFG